MLNHLKTTKDRVLNLLETKPETRDSDAFLLACYYRRYFRWEWTQEMFNPIIFLQRLFESTPPESIRRNRQMIMKDKPELRGASYKARQEEAKRVKEWAIG